VLRPDAKAYFGACLLLAAVALAASARADSPAEKLRRVQDNALQSQIAHDNLVRQAAALATEISALRRDSILAAEAAQQHEAALSALEDQLQSLTQDETQESQQLALRETERSGLLMALTRLARNPPEALALVSSDPIGVERSALLMGETVPPLDRAARDLADHLRHIAALRVGIAQARERHRAEQRLLDNERLSLAAVIARKSELQHRASKSAEELNRRIAALGQEAASLKDLIEQLEADRKAHEHDEAAAQEAATALALPPIDGLRPPGAEGPSVEMAAPALAPPDPARPPNVRSFREAQGHFLVPASGRLVRGYGQNDELGVQSKGLTFETRSAAQVVTPFDGRVLFAGPFRGYGQIVILEHGDGYHSLLAGIDRIDVTVGQWLVAGEPVGLMPQGADKPRLYLELRHDGQPINPSPWLAASNEKVTG
jgi:murein hydrolase activator